MLMTSCRAKTPKYLLASFTFEGGFNKDTVSVFFLKDTILKDEIVTSSKIVDLSDLRLEFFGFSNSIIIEDGHKNILKEIKYTHDIIGEDVVFVLNSYTFYLRIDTILGKYIGISKLALDSLNVERSKAPRHYD